MINFLTRWKRRHFRGAVITTVPHWDGGELVQYTSGYVEYHGTKGEVIDVERDLFYQAIGRRTWICSAYGGGTAVHLYNKSRDEAMQEVARNLGSVAHVDESRGLIFYKPAGYVPQAKLPDTLMG